MPIYDYKCPKCDTTVEEFVHNSEEAVTCQTCGQPMTRQFPLSFNFHAWPAEGVYLEHVSATGETFHSKGEMKRYAKEHDLELGALL